MIKPAIRVCKLGAFILAVCGNILAPLLISIKSEFGIDTQMSGVLISAYFAGNCLTCVVISKLMNKFGKDVCLKAGVGAMAVLSLLMGIINLFPLVCLDIFLLGCASLTVQLSSNNIATDLSENGVASSMSSILAMNALGSCIGLLFAGRFDTWGLDWRTVYVAFGILSAICAVICFFTKFPVLERKSDEGKIRDVFRPLSNLRFALVLFCGFLYAGGETSICNWLVTYAVENRDFTTFAGSILTSFIWIFIFVGRLFFAKVTKKISPKKILLVLYPMTALMIFTVPFTNGTLIWIVAAVMGFALSGIWPMITDELVYIGAKTKRVESAAVMSVAFMLGHCSNTIIPYFIGFVANELGMKTAILTDACMFVIAFIVFALVFYVSSKRDKMSVFSK